MVILRDVRFVIKREERGLDKCLVKNLLKQGNALYAAGSSQKKTIAKQNRCFSQTDIPLFVDIA